MVRTKDDAGIKQLDTDDRRTPSKDRMRDLQVRDLEHHIRELNPGWTKPAKTTKADLVDILFILLEEHMEDELDKEELPEQVDGYSDYATSNIKQFDGPFPPEFGKHVAELPRVVSLRIGWDHIMTRSSGRSRLETSCTISDWQVLWGDITYTLPEWNQQLGQ